MTHPNRKTGIRAVADELGLSARKGARVVRMRAHCPHSWVATTDPAIRHCITCGLRTTEATNVTEKKA